MKKIQDFFKHIDFKSIGIVYLFSILLTFAIEGIVRSSLISLGGFIFSRGGTFVYNCLIVSLFFFIGRFFKRRLFAATFVCTFWIVLAVINSVLITMRPSPLTGNDFLVFLTAYDVTGSYLKTWQIVFVVFASLFVIGFLIFMFFNAEKVIVDYKKESAGLCVAAIVFALYSVIGNAAGVLDINFENISNAYNDSGFVYCFCNTVVGKGISKPDEYDKKYIDKITEILSDDAEIENSDELPNIVFVQLESFFDLNYYNEYKASENAVPNFTKLKEEYPTGVLNVPVFGGGTANTEFEILSGMNMDDFGGGEVPYNSILEDSTCESLAYNLAEYGYTSCAIHNHTATFYDRYKIYGNLGFDYFIPIEYMRSIKRTLVGWAKDEILSDNIFDALENTDGKDFVFTVSVQGHGGYPKEDEGFDIPLTLSDDDGSEKAFSVRYYVNMAHDMDSFIGELVERFETFDEKTVVVFYGDHMPVLNLNEKTLDKLGTFQTEYVVYSNFDFKFEPKELEAYQLGSEVMKALGLNAGVITKLNQSREEIGDNYAPMLRNMQYDILYGENFSDSKIHNRVETTLGVKKITVDNVVFDGSDLIVTCTNSTFSSVIFLNGKELPTKYFSEEILLCDTLDNLKKNDVITVCQVSDTGVVLGSSAPYIFE